MFSSQTFSFPRCFDITETGFAVKNVEHWEDENQQIKIVVNIKVNSAQ